MPRIRYRSKTTLAAAVAGTLAGILSLVILLFRLTIISETGNDYTVFGASLGVALLIPHYAMYGLALVFNWIGFGTKVRGFTLTAGILYCVSFLLAIQNWWLVLLPIILSFVGFSKQGSRNRSDWLGYYDFDD